MSQGDLLSVGEAADLLSVHPNTVRGWGEAGKIPESRVGPRQDRRYRREDVLALADDRPADWDTREAVVELAEAAGHLAKSLSLLVEACKQIEWEVDVIQQDMQALRKRLQ